MQWPRIEQVGHHTNVCFSDIIVANVHTLVPNFKNKMKFFPLFLTNEIDLPG